MQQIIVLVFIFTGTLSIRQPTCPNDQLPKMDGNERPLQCIPGSSSRLVCGEGYSCFFSGMNYVCCPTNEPPSFDQLTCPAHSLTVLDPSGLPLKCDAWTHACPRSSMTCMLIGRDYVCCERLLGAGYSTTPQEIDRKKVGRNLKALECPKRSIGLLSSSGLPVTCSTRKRCPAMAYCHSSGKRSICCELYGFASTEALRNIRRSTVAESSAKVLKQAIVASTGNEFRDIANTMVTETNDGHEDYSRDSIRMKESTDKKPIKPSRSLPVAILVRGTEIQQPSFSVVAEETARVTADSRTVLPTKILPSNNQLRRKQESVLLGSIANIQSEVAPGRFEVETEAPSTNQPSQLFSGQDKRVMAEQFLIHQIRNGWPYDEKFYRSDVDAFTPQQRQRMAQIFFADNK